MEEKYRNVTLDLGNENSPSGLILAEHATTVTIQTAAQVQKVDMSAIKSRKASALSLMSAALLNSLDKE